MKLACTKTKLFLLFTKHPLKLTCTLKSLTKLGGNPFSSPTPYNPTWASNFLTPRHHLSTLPAVNPARQLRHSHQILPRLPPHALHAIPSPPQTSSLPPPPLRRHPSSFLAPRSPPRPFHSPPPATQRAWQQRDSRGLRGGTAAWRTRDLQAAAHSPPTLPLPRRSLPAIAADEARRPGCHATARQRPA